MLNTRITVSFVPYLLLGEFALLVVLFIICLNSLLCYRLGFCCVVLQAIGSLCTWLVNCVN